MRIAAIQLSVSDAQTVEQRRLSADDSFERIASDERKADMILLPEIWGCGFFDFDNYMESAESLDGPTFQMLSRRAKELNAWILGGSIVESDGDRLYNTSLLIDRHGELVGTYRKMHLFGYQSREQEILTRGDETAVFDTEFGKIGLSTCYDLRFPEQYRAMIDKGSEIFLVVSAWPEARLEHWRLFNQMRAVENQSWLVSCNCAGTQKGSLYAGHSMAVSPTGEIVAEAGRDPCIQWSEIDVSAVKTARERFPALADRIV